MAKARVFKKQNRYYVELPEGFLAGGDMELFELRDGYYLLSRQLVPEPISLKTQDTGSDAQNPKHEPPAPTEEERAVLKKLFSIRFSQRTTSAVENAFTAGEKELLRGLEKKRFINVIRSRKYNEGVYNINDAIYPLLKQGTNKKPETAKDTSETQNRKSCEQVYKLPKFCGTSEPETMTRKTETGDRKPATGNSTYNLLATNGYLVIKDRKDAYELSEKLKAELKVGSVKGVKGFDNSFYVVTGDYYTKASATILGILKGDMDITSIATKAGVEPDGCRAVLALLAEGGEVIERKKNLFTPV